MSNPLRPLLAAAVAATTAVAMALVAVPSTPEPDAPDSRPPAVRVVAPPVSLTAAVQPLAVEPLAVSDLPDLLGDWVRRIIVPPSAGQPLPEPVFEPVVGGNSIGSAIINTYNAIEPWVQYGFELATYAVGWVPYVGWLSGQIMIFYNFGERIARSITYNIAYFLDGNVSFLQGLYNVGVDTINSFIQLGIDQWNFWLPPLPPLPPFPLAETATETEDLTLRASVEESPAPVEDEAPEAVVPITPDVVDTQGETGDAQPELIDTDIEPAEGAPDPSDPTTVTNGTVSAQGEVRGPDVVAGDVASVDGEAATDDGSQPVTVDEEPEVDQLSTGPEAPAGDVGESGVE